MKGLHVLYLVAFVDMVGLAMILPLLPFYATSYGASAGTVGALIAAFSVAQLLSAPVWGRISDRRGRRPAIVGGLCLSAVGYLLFALAQSSWMLLISRVVQGMGGGTLGVAQAYVADLSPPLARTRDLGSLSAVTSAAAVVGPALGSLLAQLGGPATPGVASASVCMVVGVLAWRLLKETGARTESGGSSRAALWRLVRHAGAPEARLVWINGLGAGAFYGTAVILPLLLATRLGVTQRTIGYFVMYLGLVGALVRVLLLGRLADCLGEARLARVGAVVLAAALGLTAVAGTYPEMWLAFTLGPVGTACLFTAVTSLLSRVVPAPDRGLMLSVQQTVGGTARVAFPLMAGGLMQWFGTGMPFLVSGMLVLSTLSLMGPLDRYASGAAA